MTEFIREFKKAGGFRLLLQYLKSGIAFYAFFQLILTGKSHKALEILRLGIQLKTQKRLRKKYGYLLKENTAVQPPSTENKISDKIWICWLQGIEQAPELVKLCYNSIRKNIENKEIIVITERNRRNYIALPEWIEQKYEKGIITHTHFSDILRIALLARYGGTWIDATVFCSGKNIPDYMLNSNFFLFQNLKPGADGHVLNISSWFITAQKGQKIILAVEKMIYEYWKKNNYQADYFLLHHFFSLTRETFHTEWKNVIEYPNSMPHILLMNLFEPFNIEQYEALTQICPFHKLAYKRSHEDFLRKGTYYDYIKNKNR